MKTKKNMALILCAILMLALASPALAEDAPFTYRFVNASEAAELLLANREYYENFSQNDINFRLQKLGGTLEEMKEFAATQTLDFTEEEKAAIDDGMAAIAGICASRGYTLPPVDEIIFAKTTMREECGAAAYTHGTQIYLGSKIIEPGLSDDPEDQQYFLEVLAHELFHCLTRNYPDFRAAMYEILGFTVAEEDFPLPQTIRDVMISNPDVEHHNSYAGFLINGEMKDCVVVFASAKPFENPGDSFFAQMVTGLVPVDDLSTMYTSDEAANFWDVFGRNTFYVADPEETLADNFSYTIVYGPESMAYETPEIIASIDALLKSQAWEIAPAA